MRTFGYNSGMYGQDLIPSEKRVNALVLDGLSNKEIGFRLGLREATVRVYVSHVLAKKGFYSRYELLGAEVIRLRAELCDALEKLSKEAPHAA